MEKLENQQKSEIQVVQELVTALDLEGVVFILRRNGYHSITIAQRFLSHDIDKLFALVEWNSPALKRG